MLVDQPALATADALGDGGVQERGQALVVRRRRPGRAAAAGTRAAAADHGAEVAELEGRIDGDLAAAGEPAGRGGTVQGFPGHQVFEPDGAVADHRQQHPAGPDARPHGQRERPGGGGDRAEGGHGGLQVERALDGSPSGHRPRHRAAPGTRR